MTDSEYLDFIMNLTDNCLKELARVLKLMEEDMKQSNATLRQVRDMLITPESIIGGKNV